MKIKICFTFYIAFIFLLNAFGQNEANTFVILQIESGF